MSTLFRHTREPGRNLPGPLATLAASTLLLAMGPAPEPGQWSTGWAQEAPLLNRIDFEDPAEELRLPPSLREVSGLAFVGTRMLSHNDEDGFLVEVNPDDGSVVHWTHLGPDRVRGDFEGVASRGDTIYMITSGGTLVSFQEAEDDRPVPFKAVSTETGDLCEIEGLTTSSAGVLRAVCKVNYDDAMKGGLRILVVDPSGVPARVELELTRQQLASVGIEDLRPSGIEVTPAGHTLILSARNRMIVELDARGRPVAWVELSGSRHRQAEGIALAADGSLWIADEGGRGRGRLTRYGRVDGS